MAQNSNSEHDLSVLVCTWNNSRRLRLMLEALCQCEIPSGVRWEVVLVNNNCTDDTDTAAQEFAGRLPLVCVHEPEQGKSAALNTGMRHVRGRLVVHGDDDILPATGWIAAYWRAYCARPCGWYFGGPVASEFEGEPPHPELLALAPASVRGLSYGEEELELEAGRWFIGLNWAAPAEALRRAGEYSTQLGPNPASGGDRVGEETEMMMRLGSQGCRAWWVPEARVRHLIPASKSCLGHIAARMESAAAAEVLSRPESARGRTLVGVPLWAYGRALHLAARWAYSRLRGRRGYWAYLEWRRLKGAVTAHRERRVSGRSRAHG